MMLASLKAARLDGTFVGTLVDGREWHITPDEPFWEDAVAMASVGMPPLEVLPDDYPPSEAEIAGIIQSHIDAQAQAWEYNDASTLAGYVASAIPQWAAEAQAFVAWRDAVWIAIFGYRSNPETAPHTIEALIASLPILERP